jgi:hypothetical protein
MGGGHMSPTVSILMPTYARTALVAEQVESFRRRVYQGNAELVILNDCPLQTLTCDVPGVRVLNTSPFDHFGLKRHALTKYANGQLWCIQDDDDVMLPRFLSSLVPKLRDGEPAARLSHLWRWDGVQLISGPSGLQHSTIFRREAYIEPVVWRDLPSTEADTAFWLEALRHGWFTGDHHSMQDGHREVIYRADIDRLHLEVGNNRQLTEQEYRALMDARIQRGEEPTGVVDIEPCWSRDWQDMANVADPGVP